MNTTYRLLNVGELIQEGDEYWSTRSRWEPVGDAAVAVKAPSPFSSPIRRARTLAPEPIAFSERLPTKEDANANGELFVFFKIKPQWNVVHWQSGIARGQHQDKYSHWMREPAHPVQPLSESRKAFEAFWDNWLATPGRFAPIHKEYVWVNFWQPCYNKAKGQS